MNKPYTVIWKRSLIEKTLASLVLAAMQRGEDVSALTTAMTEIDRTLAADPETRGESRGDFERVLIVAPLTVTFEVHPEERIVYVLRARYAPRRPGASEE